MFLGTEERMEIYEGEKKERKRHKDMTMTEMGSVND